jgi:hypothetical protein
MCVTHIYSDRYPDGHTVTFRRLMACQYGKPGRPCSIHSSIEEPLRNINWGDSTTEELSRPRIYQPAREPTPPRSPHGSHHRHSSSESSGHRRKPSKRLLSPLRPTRQHRKERIVIVDSPPTPRTPPQHFSQTFTAPSSPATPTYRSSHENVRGRPIIVDERPLRRIIPSMGAVISDRRPMTPRSSREHSRPRSQRVWDSPSSSHTSFNSRLRHEEEEIARLRAQELQRERERQSRRDFEAREVERKLRKDMEAKIARAEFIRRQDAEIRARPVVPLASLSRRQTVVDQEVLPFMMGALAVEDDGKGEEEEAMKRRLRERQMPKRRFSVGPAQRRHRVAYDDGMYRWE